MTQQALATLLLDSLQRRMATMHGLYYQARPTTHRGARTTAESR